MVKNVIVTFEYDSETESVKNVQCVVDGVEKTKKTTTKKKKESDLDESRSMIILESNKLVFNNKAIDEMEVDVDDRILIKWEKDNTKKIAFPTIGTDISFENEGSGNKLTKSHTVAYRGNQNTLLAELGSSFVLEPFKDGIWKMISVEKPEAVKDISSAIKSVEKIEQPDILTTEDENIEIDELTFNFNLN